MNKGVALVGGLGLGAALMYILDPDRGKGRRALIRDKFGAAGNKANDLAGKMSRDLRNRAYGIAVETKSIFRHEEISDDVLADRVRSKIGRLAVDIGVLDVTASNGVVTLRGQILAEHLPRLLRYVGFVRGVKDIDNQLDVQAQADDVPPVQGQPQPLGA